MSNAAFNISMIFRAETSAAKAAVAEMKQEVGSATTETGASTAAVQAHSTALERDAIAAQKAAEGARKRAEAEKRARDEALKNAGVPSPANTPKPGNAPVHFGPQIPKQIEDLRAQYVPLYGLQRDYQRELTKIDAAHKVGAIGAEDYRAAMVRLKASHDLQVAAFHRLNPALAGTRQNMKLNAHEAKNLSYQINDVVQTIALGMPLQQVLMQQGPQITQIYGGVGNTFRALSAVLTPARIALGATTGTVLLGASAWNGYLKSTKAVATAADGIGRATAGTSANMEASAIAGAAAAGIGIKAARSMEVQFLRTGKIGAENFEHLIGLSKDFAVTIGIEAGAAGGALADMFSDPAKAADTLLNRYGLIDAATARQASNLAAQNRLSEAQGVLIDALPARLASASEATTGLARAWEDVKNNASSALDSAGQFIDRALDSDPEIDPEIEARGHLLAYQRARAKKESSESGTFLGGLRGYVSHAGDLDTERDDLYQFMEARRRSAAELMAKVERDAGEQRGRVALGLAQQSPAIADALKREELANQIKALELGRDAPGLDDQQRGQIETVIEARKNALDGLINSQARSLQLDQLSISIQNEKNPLLRAELEAQRARLQLAGEELNTEKLDAAAAKARLRVMSETIGASEAQARGMREEFQARARLNDLVVSGTMTTEQANRQLELELQLRPLVTAAALAEGEEKARLLDVIKQLRDGYDLLEDQRARSAADGFLRSQQKSLDQLQLETSLLGASAAQRSKVIALFEAEQEMQERGIDRNSAEAGTIRENARAIADQTRELDKLKDAWGKVQSSAESAIDTMTDDLLKGDISGAVENIAKEFTGMLTELAIKNPLKNAMLGTDLGTLDDLGGLKGIWGRLTGRDEGQVPRISTRSMSTGSMMVTASNVTINGVLGAAGAVPTGGAANVNGGLPGQANVQDQVWNFFAGKGLKPHQIAGIMGNVSAESGFNPLAVGDGGNAFGLFQHNDRGPKLLQHLGGRGNLGDIQGQLEFVWKELQTSEAASLARLKAATNVREATGAFVGFERPRGYSVANPEGSLHFDRRLDAAEQAMTKFSTVTNAATENLGVLGTGFGDFGQLLGSLVVGKTGLGGGGGASGGSLWGDVFSGIAGALGIPGFRDGSYTGGSDPSKVAGFVHEKEFVFDAVSTSKMGVSNLEALRKGSLKGFREGGSVSPLRFEPSGGNANQAGGEGPVVTIHNYSGQPVSNEETVGPGGRRQSVITVGEQGAAAVAQRGNPLSRQLEQTFGLKRRGIQR